MMGEKIILKDYFPQLGEDCNAYVECYVPMQLAGMGEMIHPCMVVCPGGGYAEVCDREAEPMVYPFLQDGYAVFVLRYSVKPMGFPKPLREAAALMELLFLKEKEWHIQPKDVTIMGFSAGGHLAAQYSTRYADPVVRELFPDSKPVQQVILGYPVITGDPTYRHADTRLNFLEGVDDENPDAKGFSCEKRVGPDTPPTFLWHTAEDGAVVVENSLLYAMALSANKVPFELHVYPYGPHGYATADEWTCKDWPGDYDYCHSWLADAKKWLKMIKRERHV